MGERTVCHLNIIGFKTAVAAVKDKSLRGRPYVIAGGGGGRSLALCCSPEAIRQGLSPGMALAAAERQVKDLTVLEPDPRAYEAMNRELEALASRYAPVWENDNGGNLYLDITGTTGIFGPPVDCSSRVLKDILGKTEIKPSAAVASNKLVSKVATRAIRPVGLIQVQAGIEAEFFDHQDIRILPGMGPGLLRTATVTGIREIGEIARLSDSEVVALFGKKGPLLRNMALGIDNTCVEGGARRIKSQADFKEDTIEEIAIKGAIRALAESGGLKMRNEKLGMKSVRLGVLYSDGVMLQGFRKTKGLFVLDKEIIAACYAILEKQITRRIRIRSIGLSFEELQPLSYQPDLFEPEEEITNRNLQKAIDKIQNRYGAGKITRALVLAASAMQGGQASYAN
ncbi:MAG: DNA polymerase [Treponema sp.]|nr:DNA polymerase [Treponema sp.]